MPLDAEPPPSDNPGAQASQPPTYISPIHLDVTEDQKNAVIKLLKLHSERRSNKGKHTTYRAPGYTIKLVLIGFSGSGKECFLERLFHGYYEENRPYDPTLEVMTYRKVLSVFEQPVLLQCELEDCSVSEPDRLPFSLRLQTHEHDICLLAFSASSRHSFETIVYVQKKFGSPPRPLFVIMTKIDLPSDQIEVSLEEAKRFSDSIGAVFLAVSSKTNIGCRDEDAMAIALRVLVCQAEALKQARATQAAQEAQLASLERRNNSKGFSKTLGDFSCFKHSGDG